MRFRGTLAKDALAVLLDVALAFSRLSAASSNSKAGCVFTLSPAALAVALKSSGEELQSFARLPLDRVFHDVTVQSRADDHIGFVCDIRHFHRALTSGKDASAVMLRLLKRDGNAFLCLRTRVSGPSNSIQLKAGYRLMLSLQRRPWTSTSCRASRSRCCP